MHSGTHVQQCSASWMCTIKPNPRCIHGLHMPRTNNFPQVCTEPVALSYRNTLLGCAGCSQVSGRIYKVWFMESSMQVWFMESSNAGAGLRQSSDSGSGNSLLCSGVQVGCAWPYKE